jgi:GNAT superfamily N-acetyltransferase
MVRRASGLLIRPVSGPDVPQVSALIRNTLLVSNARDYDLETIRALMASFSTDAVRALTQRREMFVCLERDRLCGVVGFEDGEIYTFFVAPDRQGRGVGRALLGFIETRAGRREFRRLKVSASLTAVGFYERHGYRRTGSESDGRFGRTVELVKALPPP